MAQSIEALIMPAAAVPPEATVVALAPQSGLALLPVTAQAPGPRVHGFYELTTAVTDRARRLSRGTTVAYLHSEFFGGGGFQAAVAWRDGQIVWGPVFTATSAGEAEAHYTVPAGPHDMAGNVLLRRLGVRRQCRRVCRGGPGPDPDDRNRPRMMAAVDARDLTERERAVLSALLAVDFDGAPALRGQAAGTRVAGGCPCGCPTIHFVTGDGRGMNPKVNGFPRGSYSSLFLYTVVDPDGQELLGGIEWAGIDESPAEFPPPAAMQLSAA